MKGKRLLTIVLCLALSVLSVIGIWKTVYISADIDESYALTMAVRISQGDKLFVTMWEPHQMSALLYAPFVWAYQSIAGHLDGVLVFMRWLGIAVQAFVSICVYRCFKKVMPSALSAVSAFAYFNFTPKHIQSPEFTSLCYWLLMLLILSMTSYEREGKKRFVVFAGLSMSGLVLCYPAMLAVFIVCVIRLVCEERTAGRKEKEQTKSAAGRKEKEQTKSAVVLFAGICVLAGVLFLLYLFGRGGVRAVLGNIPNILADASHEQNLALVWKNHVAGLWDMLKLTMPVIILFQVGRPVLDKKDKHKGIVLSVIMVIQAVWSLVQFHTITKVNFTIFYPIVLQLFVIGWYAAVCYPHEREKKMAYRTGLWMNLAGVLCILSSSNLDAMYSMPFLMPSVLMGIAMIWDVVGESGRSRVPGIVYRIVFITVLAVFMVQLLTARIFLVRFTSTQRKNIFEGYYKTDTGILKGISLGEFDYQQYEAKMQALKDYVTERDVFLYVGCDMFLYSALGDAKIGTGNTISTPVFSEQLMQYYEAYPQRIPTVVFVDREYVDDFSAVLQEQPFQSFMETYFDAAPVICGPVSIYTRERNRLAFLIVRRGIYAL